MLRLQLIGGMRVWLDDTVVEPPSSRRAWGLLAWLALHPGHHPRSVVAATFWPDVPDSSARASLRSAVWALRRTFGARLDDYLVLDRDRIGLRDDAVLVVDTREVETLGAAGRLEEAAERGVGDLLPDFDDDWALDARTAHRSMINGILESLAAAAEESGDSAAAISWTSQQVRMDPLAETPRRRMMTRYAAAGDRGAALEVYRRFRDRLARELGLEPSGETTRLATDLANGRRVNQPPPWSSTPAWPLAGRTRELDQLLGAWHRAVAGRATVAAIGGEPGIGKTRLAGELLDRAARDGAVVVAATTLDLGVSAPFALWAELIGALGSVIEPPPKGAAWPSALAPLAPSFGSGRPPGATGTVSSDLERARLYEAIVGLLQWAGRSRPLALLLEDIHLADAASLDLTGYVLRRLAASPVLMVLTHRPAPRSMQVDALEQSLRTQRMLTVDLTLGPLSGEQGAGLVREIANLPPGQVHDVVTAADGIPLLLIEWTSALARGETAPPKSLRATVGTALAPLAGDALELARFAAVAGRSLERDEIEALALTSSRQSLSAAAECGVLTLERGRVGYRHALLREAAYADLPPPVRDGLHERFGHVLADLEPRRAAEASRHLRLGGRDDLVVAQLVRAANHARTVAALPEAADMLAEAVRLEPRSGSLKIELAEVQALRGEIDASDAAFTAGIADLVEPVDLAEAWVRRATWYSGALCHPRLALAAARRAVSIIDNHGIASPLLKTEALALSSWAESVAGDVRTADALLDQVHGLLGKQRPDDRLVPAIARARAFVLVRRGRFRESYPPEIASAEASRRLGRPDLAYGAWANAACAATCAGEFDRALEFVDRGLAEISDCGLDILEFHLLAGRAHVLARLGRRTEAYATAARQRAIADRLGNPALLALADHDAGLLALRLGDPGAAAGLLGAALDADAAVSRPITRLHRADALVQLARLDEAEDELRRTALEPVTPGDLPDTLVPRLTWLQGRIARGRGESGRSRVRLEEAAAGWRRVIDRTARGDQFVATLADFGRPPMVGLVEPEAELARVLADLAATSPAHT